MTDPIPALFQSYRALEAATKALPEGEDISDEFMEPTFWTPMRAIEEAMMALPCQTPADVAMKAIVATVNGGVTLNFETDPFWQEMRALAASE